MAKPLDCFERALSTARTVGNRMLEAAASGNIGVILLEMNKDISIARDHLSAGVDGYRETNYRRSVVFEACLARCEEKLGNWKKARNIAIQALKISQLGYDNDYDGYKAHKETIDETQRISQLTADVHGVALPPAC